MNKYNVMIVDDEPHIVEMLKIRLEANGFAVVDMFNGREALAVLGRPNKIDVVMTDIMMPGMDGIELLKEIKEISPELEVVMMTGFASLDTAIEAVRLGAFDYIKKPFEDMGGLMRVVKNAAEKRKMALENKRLTEELMKANKKLKTCCPKTAGKKATRRKKCPKKS